VQTERNAKTRMTGRFVLSPRARADLEEIWDYTADRRGLDQAETYTRALWQRIEAIAAEPAMGQDCSDIRAGYWKIPLRLACAALQTHC
jgi:toxin ParE1/3/4